MAHDTLPHEPIPAAAGLDAEELLHLAAQAMQASRDDEALSLLKRGLALAPDDGRLHYLLGALHAHLGMVDRAMAGLQRAVQLAPGMSTAHFQLGLLKLTSGDLDGARAAWSSLDGLAAAHPLARFRAGMLSLVADDFDACIESLRLGVAAEGEHSALAAEMQRVIAAAERARAAPRSAPEPAHEGAAAADAASATPAEHVLLAGYRSSVVRPER